MVMQLAAKETLRCTDIVEEMFVNLHECIDKKGKNIENELTREDISAIKKRMHEIVNDDIPFIRMEEETEEVISKFEQHGLTDKTGMLKHRGRNYSAYYKLNGHIDSFYGYMVPSTGYLKVFDLNK